MKALPIQINQDQENNALDGNLSSGRRVASVVLNYNNVSDLLMSAPQLAEQKNVEHTLIIVDNASRPEAVGQIMTWLADWRPDAIVGTQTEVDTWVKSNPEEARASGRVYFIMHHENRGYSAGNNIGIRLADELGADAVLIANPDMRIVNQNYLAALSRQLYSDEHNFIVASRIVGLDGENQNPLRESTLWEEVFWPRFYLAKIFGTPTYVLPTTAEKPIAVPKVSGCCLMLRMSFLKATSYLDENVFLYCEEPILSARVRMNGGETIYVPSVSAVHAHIKTEKGNAGKRMLLFIKSRKYYLNTYSGYSWWQLQFLSASYCALAMLNRVKSAFGK